MTRTLPAKNMEYFLFQRFFDFLCSAQGVSVFEIHSYEQILLLGELISTQQQNEAQIISVFSSIKLWLELLSLCQIAAISILVLYGDIVCNTIVCLPPILVRSAGD